MDRTVRREIELPASPEAAWAAIADPGRLGDWLDADVDLDLRPGGGASFRFVDGQTRRARVVDVEWGRRLTFTWWPVEPVSGAPTLVTITVEAVPTGARVVVREGPSARSRAAA